MANLMKLLHVQITPRVDLGKFENLSLAKERLNRRTNDRTVLNYGIVSFLLSLLFLLSKFLPLTGFGYETLAPSVRYCALGKQAIKFH